MKLAQWSLSLKLVLLVRSASPLPPHQHLNKNNVVTSIAAGRVADLIGRKMTLFWGAVIFTVGGAIQTGTTGYTVMVLGRIISGFGVGLLSSESI